ncbi:hypothetical protein GCM10009746_25670 [Microbacterium paludicola]
MVATTTIDTPPRRRRGRGLIALVVILILVVLAAVAGEFAARGIVRDQVRERAVAALGLPADHPVEVGLGGIVLAQLVAGRLDEVHLSSEDVPLAGLTVDADVELTGVPVRDGAAGGAGAAHLRLDDAAVEQLLAQSELPPALSGAAVALAEPDVVLSNEFEVLGTPLPVELAVTPGAAEGALTLTPARARLGELDLGLDQLAAVIGVTPEPTSVCIADRLPAGFEITAVAVVGDHLEADADIAEGTLSDPALQQPGTCD